MKELPEAEKQALRAMKVCPDKVRWEFQTMVDTFGPAAQFDTDVRVYNLYEAILLAPIEEAQRVQLAKLALPKKRAQAKRASRRSRTIEQSLEDFM